MAASLEYVCPKKKSSASGGDVRDSLVFSPATCYRDFMAWLSVTCKMSSRDRHITLHHCATVDIDIGPLCRTAVPRGARYICQLSSEPKP